MSGMVEIWTRKTEVWEWASQCRKLAERRERRGLLGGVWLKRRIPRRRLLLVLGPGRAAGLAYVIVEMYQRPTRWNLRKVNAVLQDDQDSCAHSSLARGRAATLGCS